MLPAGIIEAQKNLAFNKPAYQSSTHEDGVPGHAVGMILRHAFYLQKHLTFSLLNLKKVNCIHFAIS